MTVRRIWRLGAKSVFLPAAEAAGRAVPLLFTRFFHNPISARPMVYTLLNWIFMLFCFAVAAFLHLRGSRRFFLLLQGIEPGQADAWQLRPWRHYTGRWYAVYGVLLLLRLVLEARGYAGWGNGVLLLLLAAVVWVSMQRYRFRKEPEA